MDVKEETDVTGIWHRQQQIALEPALEEAMDLSQNYAIN